MSNCPCTGYSGICVRDGAARSKKRCRDHRVEESKSAGAVGPAGGVEGMTFQVWAACTIESWHFEAV